MRFVPSVEAQIASHLEISLEKENILLLPSACEELIKLVSCRMILEDHGSVGRYKSSGSA